MANIPIEMIGKRFGGWLVLDLGEPYSDVNKTRRWKCQCSCGNISLVGGNMLRRGKSKSCGCLRDESFSKIKKGKYTGDKSHNWNGGKCKIPSGYIRITAGPEAGKPEHHSVMEKILGRKLLPKETVHHKNGFRDDNRPENLELWSSRHHPGQRIEDLIVWAEDVLKQYAPEKLKCPK